MKATDLEARLVHVEGMLRDVSGSDSANNPAPKLGEPSQNVDLNFERCWSAAGTRDEIRPPLSLPFKPIGVSDISDESLEGAKSSPDRELIGLGQFESLPPLDMVEEL